MLDYWAHAFTDNPNLADEVVAETEDFDAELAAFEAEDAALPDDFETVANDTFEVEQ